MNDPQRQVLVTPSGEIALPAYIPVTTFGKKYPLDELVRPYLRRLAPAVMVSFHYARQMRERPNLPMLIDSGGFASLFRGASVIREQGLGVLQRESEEGRERLHPRDVLDFQENHADVAFTLDFPIPPNFDREERSKRWKLSIANAHWALANRRRRQMPLFACVQGWDLDSYRVCAREYAGVPFEGIAIGGLVPRAQDRDQVLRIVGAVREEIPDRPLHVFGLGKPELVGRLFDLGVQSVDSSAYVKLAADGRLWGTPSFRLPDASPAERLNLALCNLATACNSTLPLSARTLFYSTAALNYRTKPAEEEDQTSPGIEDRRPHYLTAAGAMT